MDTKTRCLNRELTIEMIVGTFIASVVVVLIFFTIVISGSRLLQGGRTKASVSFDNVGGLRRSDSVLMRGVPIGKVEKLRLYDSKVDVSLSLNERIRLRDGYRITVEHSSMLGGQQLVIEEGKGELLPEGTPWVGHPPIDVMRGIAELVQEVRSAIGDGGMFDDLKQAAHDISRITGRLERGEGTLGMLLSSDDSVYRDLQGAMAGLRKIAERIETGQGTLGRLMSAEDTLYADLQSAVSSVKTVAGRLEAGEGTMGKLFSSDETLYSDLKATVADLRAVAGRIAAGEGTLGRLMAKDDRLYSDLAEVAANLRTVTGRLESGEGLLGQLMSKDSALTRDLEGLLKDARDSLDDMREAAPISTFSSIFFGVF